MVEFDKPEVLAERPDSVFAMLLAAETKVPVGPHQLTSEEEDK